MHLEEPMTLRAALYLRISEDRSGEELGVTRQREDCLKLAELRGYSVLETCRDNDVSALTTKTRDGFERILELIQTGQIDVVISWTFERLLKTRRDQMRFMELGQSHSTVLALVRGSDFDMSTANGRMLADIVASTARNETELKSERQVRAYRQQAEAGKPHFVSRPYGYERNGEVVEPEAAVLNQMAQYFLIGWSTTEITTWLNDNEIPAASGGHWSRRVVKDHLLSKRSAGIRVYKGQEFPGTWTPIFSKDLHARLVSEWQRRHGDGKRARSDTRRYLLTGLLYCGRCGAKMMGSAHNDRPGGPVRDKYRCVPGDLKRGCGNLMRVAVTIDHLVTESVLYRLDTPEMKALLVAQESRAAEIDPLRQKEAALRDRLDEFEQDRTDGLINRDEYFRLRDGVLDRLRVVEVELSALYSSEQAQALLSPITTLREAWGANPMSWRRRLLSLVIERIDVEPDRARPDYYVDGSRYKFNPDSVKITWRH